LIDVECELNPAERIKSRTITPVIREMSSVIRKNSKMKQSVSENIEVPVGKVSCLLCGGFISVQGGDRARFIDHMSNEHDAKTDCHDVLLAVCVFDVKEKGFLVKSSVPRLDQIGKSQKLTYTNSFLSKLIPPVPSVPQSYSSPRIPQQTNRVRGPSQRGSSVRIQRPIQPQKPPVTQSQVPVPRMLHGNGSISISKVDMSRKCSMCNAVLPNPTALAQHMNNSHFPNLGGINIISGSDHDSSTEKKQITSNSEAGETAIPVTVPTPKSYLTPIRFGVRPQALNGIGTPKSSGSPNNLSTRSGPARIGSPQALNCIGTPKSGGSPNNLNTRSGPARIRSPATYNSLRSRMKVSVVKCTVCLKTIEKSKYDVHRLTHSQEKKNLNLKKEVLKGRLGNNSSSCDVEVIDIDEGEGSHVIQTEVKSLPEDKIYDSKKDSKVEDELLLHEEGDKPADKKAENEIENMETTELLDNLVNFLNDV